jgi:type VI secretion system protein ImpJ
MTRVDWHMGQALLPEHFQTQEESLWAESALRFSLLAKPAWGLGEFSWDPSRLETGLLLVDKLSLVFESGTVLSIPGNASTASLDLTQIGSTNASVFVLRKEGTKKVNVPVEDKGQGSGGKVRRLELNIELSTEQSSGEECFKLAEVRQDAKGAWSFCDDYVPPLLRVRPGVLFDAFLRRTDELLVQLRQLLAKELQENHLSGETHILAKQALRSLFGLQATLTDIRGDVFPHPQELYNRLRTLLIDLAVLGDLSKAAETATTKSPYKHDSLAECFGLLLNEAEAITARGSRAAPYVKFTKGEGAWHCDLPKHARAARYVYLMVQKREVAARLQLGRVKLASPKRLKLLHERSLPGIAFSEVERPPFAQVLSSAIDFYSLAAGQEWDFAVAEGQVVLYDTEALKDCDLYLYFRTG